MRAPRRSAFRAKAGAVLFVGVGLLPNCASPSNSQVTSEHSLTPVLSIKELMEHIVDPVADWIFDSAVIDVSEKGVVVTKPLTDEDWLRVERGAFILAESANLLKMTRAMVPAGDASLKQATGGPELTPGEIEAKIREDPPQWDRYADQLRVAALASLPAIKSRNAEALFNVGDTIDRACEGCHLEYWYPGDKKAVLENQRKTVTYDKPKR